ncbi:MAG: heat-shock protein Hsp20 [Flavobacteriales bacterium]|nr:heat-shock protein Hsp20 [Flavobacteriales bacterium]|tara:strand:+ start:236 stop:667 length:432 start_codon:yes stop_codon:yes gene_type:complete
MTLVKFKDNFPSFLDEFFGGDIFDSMQRTSSIGNSLPAVNIKQTESGFHLELAAPGKKKEDFKIELDNNVLSISSENKFEKNENEEKYTRREFSYSSFRRTFTLPDSVDAEGISASYNEGVLNIDIPKMKEEKKANSKLININ